MSITEQFLENVHVEEVFDILVYQAKLYYIDGTQLHGLCEILKEETGVSKK